MKLDAHSSSPPLSESHRRACMRSRRGLLELDLLLLPFAEHVYAELSESERQVYEQLLLEDDVVLIEWLKGEPVGECYAQAMVNRIRRWHVESGPRE